MNIPDPIQDAHDRFTELDADTAARCLTEAQADMQGPLGSRSLGFAVIDSMQKGDGRNYRVVITDGEQDGVIVARLTGSQLATSDVRGREHEHLVERLHQASGSLPNDGNRWLNMVLQPQPLHL